MNVNPCKNCGKRSGIITARGSTHSVECRHCGCYTRNTNNRNDAIYFWNQGEILYRDLSTHEIYVVTLEERKSGVPITVRSYVSDNREKAIDVAKQDMRARALDLLCGHEDHDGIDECVDRGNVTCGCIELEIVCSDNVTLLQDNKEQI